MVKRDNQQSLSAEEFQRLLLTGQAISQERDPNLTCRLVADTAASLLGTSLVSFLFTLDKNCGSHIVSGSLRGSPIPQSLASALLEAAVVRRAPVQDTDGVATLYAGQTPQVLSDEGISHLILVSASTVDGGLVTMMAGRDRHWELNTRETFILTTLANQSAVAIINARLYKEKETSEQRLSKIYEYSNDAIFVIDPANDAIIDVNRAARKMLEYSREQLLSMPVSSIHPLEMPKLQAFAQTVLEKGHGWTDEITCTTATGQALPTEMSASVVEIEGRACIIAIVRDISERREAHETLHQQMRELAVLGERNRIAREIHDTLAQGLTGIIWQVNAAMGISKNGDEKLRQSLERARTLARESLQEARRAVSDLRPGSLENFSLVEALNREVNKVGEEDVQASFNVSGEERVLPSGVEAALLRICQESLTNVLKHASATKVHVTLAFDQTTVQLSVKDNGQGFAPGTDNQKETDQGGFGLANMLERAHLLGGRVDVESAPGSGTQVEAVLPLK